MRNFQRRRASRGSAMIEVIISVLLLAIAAAAVFGAILSASFQTKTASSREQGSLLVENLLDELRNFVTADAAGAGPGAAGNWKVSGDLCSSCISAMDLGVHNIDISQRGLDSILLAGMVARHATLAYTVTAATVNGVTSTANGVTVTVQFSLDPIQ